MSAGISWLSEADLALTELATRRAISPYRPIDGAEIEAAIRLEVPNAPPFAIIVRTKPLDEDDPRWEKVELCVRLYPKDRQYVVYQMGRVTLKRPVRG